MFHLHACHIFWHVEYFWTCLEVQLIVIKAVNNISVSWCLFNEPIEIDELMKLANHSDQEAKGAICIYIFISKKTIQRWKYITPMEFAKHLRKSDVSEKSTIYYGQFLWNGLHDFC